MWAIAQLEEHCTVTAVVAGSSPVSPPKSIADFQLPIANLHGRHSADDLTIGNWQLAIGNEGAVAER